MLAPNNEKLISHVAFFCSAIKHVRDNAPYSDPAQRGYIEIKTAEDGSVTIEGYYSHESKRNVYEALAAGGFLSISGFQYQKGDERFVYKAEGIRNDDALTLETLTTALRYVEQNVVFHNPRQEKNGIVVYYNFP